MFSYLYETLLTKINDGSKCAMLTFLSSQSDPNGHIGKKFLLTKEDVENKSYPLHNDVYEKINLSLDTGKLEIINIEENKNLLIEPFVPKPRLIIFGGGHVAKPVSEFATRVGFSITVIDDRPSFANIGRFPDAEKVICESFEKSFDLINFRKTDFVVIVTRGHRHDGIVLREALQHDLSYTGMIGSKRRVRAMMEELSREGFAKEKLDLVKSPIGIDIGAVTPDEIAISIIAQLISFKNKSSIDRFGKGFVFPEFDVEVVQNISEESSMPRALITILSSKGSTPRKAGAKMVLYQDGRTIGSIGGGCSEAGVIASARTIMADKGFLIEHVDMTGEVAESEGMVCGGIMDVLIEVF
ncbi:MAG: XdhC family protein [Lutispora sp.]|nr:XdhC family protein [Lutispora sp.]MDD4833804.1 XdhC family protein [Lutispora sp.]